MNTMSFTTTPSIIPCYGSFLFRKKRGIAPGATRNKKIKIDAWFTGPVFTGEECVIRSKKNTGTLDVAGADDTRVMALHIFS